MAKRIIYFTAGPIPTTDEKAAIAALNARALPVSEVLVRNAEQSQNYGSAKEACDYVAGTRPAAYPIETYPVVPPGLAPANGGAMNVRNSAASKTVAGALVVAAGVITSVDLPATAALLTSTQAVTVGGATYTFTIAGGVITAIVVS